MKEKKQSLALAMLTSLLVLVLGAAIWGVLYYYGWFSAWVAFLAVACASLCWQRFYKTNWALYVWTAVWSIVLNIVSMLLTFIVAIQLFYNCSFSIAAELFPSVFSGSQNIFILDCVLSVVFTGLGVLFAFLNTRYARKKAAQKQAAEAATVVENTTNQTNPTEKIADYFVSRFVKMGEIEDAAEREAKLNEFREQYLSKLDAATKEAVVKTISSKAYTASEVVAVELLKEELK